MSSAPSTPPPENASSYFLLTHAPSAAFLQALPCGRANGDSVLLLEGSGAACTLLEAAVGVLRDKSLVDENNWEYVKSADGDKPAPYYCTKTNALEKAVMPKGISFDELHVETERHSYAEMLNTFTDAGLRCVITLPSPSSDCPLVLHILERPPLAFPRLSLTPISTINPTGHPYNVPSLDAFRDGWRAWDHITLGMIPPSLLHSTPIDLRHKPLFYIGHLPTFLNILLTRHLGEKPVAPIHFTQVFERGIDPHVDDPEYCHSHSEVPERDEDWPVLEEVLAYRDRVRARLAEVYEEVERGEWVLTRRLARTLMMVLEHDGFHIETLLYILIQRAGTGMLPPPGFTFPPWPHLAAQWDAAPPPTISTVALGPCTLTMGHDDPEPADLLPEFATAVADHEFGWDNESPQRVVSVGKFRVEWRPITNGEFLTFYEGADKKRAVGIPASWVRDPVSGEFMVRTLYGPVAMTVAGHWPVLTSYDDLVAYAQSKGGRIPSEPELRLFLDKYQVGYEEGANTGFRNWHPMPATTGCAENGGRGSNGGVWEWTSTLLSTHKGFEGTTIFPGYSSDFYDTKHQVVLGASYATIPRLGDRRTVRNFYQHNYPYPWVGARVAYDC